MESTTDDFFYQSRPYNPMLTLQGRISKAEVLLNFGLERITLLGTVFFVFVAYFSKEYFV